MALGKVEARVAKVEKALNEVGARVAWVKARAQKMEEVLHKDKDQALLHRRRHG